MRKQTKLVAVLSAAALLAMGASMTSFAEEEKQTGWCQEDGEWVYYDKDGDQVTETWKKSLDNYYWLDEDGIMATEQIVDDGENKYYVDATGARVTNQWVNTDNDDDWGDVDTVWYYFGSNGKAVEGKKTINGKTYIFDEGGYMFSGWKEYKVNGKDEMFYLGTEDEGWAYTGWQLLEIDEDVQVGDYDDEEYFNFKSSGVMRKNGRAYLDGHYYEFDAYGVMVDGWVPPVTTDPNATYYSESGAQPKGWVLTYAQNDANEEGDQYWYYLDSKGKPFNVACTATASAAKYTEGKKATDKTTGVTAKVIKKKTYLFNNKGQMMTGVYELDGVARVNASNTTATLDNGIYYFNKGKGSVEGQMMTGKQTVTYDGEEYNYNFNSEGKAYTNAIVDNTLYGANGARIESEDGSAVYTTKVDLTDKKGDVLVYANESVIVTPSGKVKKSGNVTIDGVKYTVSDYVVEE